MQPILNLHIWVSLPTDVRHKIRIVFNIPRSSNVVVNDGRIETDGTTTEDFKYLTVEKMQKYVESGLTDFNKLFDLVVAQIISEIEGKPKLVTIPEIKDEIINANPPKNGKKKSK